MKAGVAMPAGAAKNRAELVCGDTDMTYDAAVSRATIEMIRERWRARQGAVVVPGHDLPIRARFGDGVAALTELDLTMIDSRLRAGSRFVLGRASRAPVRRRPTGRDAQASPGPAPGGSRVLWQRVSDGFADQVDST